MRRGLLVLLGIFAVTYLVMSVTEFPATAAAIVTVVAGFGWIVLRDVRRPALGTDAQRSQDAVYAAAAIAAFHSAGQSGADCQTGVDGFSGGADCGGF